MNIDELEKPAILLGNGLNLFANTVTKGSEPYSSWESILQLIASTTNANSGLDVKALCNSSYITMPELYSILEFREDSNTEIINSLFEVIQEELGERVSYAEIRKAVQKTTNADVRYKRLIGWLMRRWVPIDDCHGAFFKFASGFRGSGLPILTTNYDSLLEKASNGGPLPQLFNRQKSGGTRYLDEQHFAHEPLDDGDKTSRFSLWHIHGSAESPNTIKISHSDYAKLLAHYQGRAAEGHQLGWLPIFFECDLVILGFGFGPEEFPLRWLLMERMKELQKLSRRVRTIYVTKKSEKADDMNRMFFFESIGVEVDKSADSYADIYRQFGVEAQ